MAVFAVLLILIPCAAFFADKPEQSPSDGGVKILITKTGSVKNVSMEDYLIGSVLAQMPADFDTEALKAQAVLAHTYALRRRMNEKLSPDPELDGADMSDDTSRYLAYFDMAQAKEFYGGDFDEAYKKVSQAVREAKDLYLSYGGEPIAVAFHAISSGKTESAENAWGENIPYLIACDSPWDLENDSCEKRTEFSQKELAARLAAAADIPENSSADGDGQSLIETADISPSGTVLSVKIGGSYEMSGQQLAAALSLPSPCFTVEYSDGRYTFVTKGYGHLVGMSQYGADYLAKDGKSCEEILKYYFPKTQLKADKQ